MEDRIWVAIHPRGSETRVLATEGSGSPLLKARLASHPWHQRALPTLLEALALSQSRRGHAVRGGACGGGGGRPPRRAPVPRSRPRARAAPALPPRGGGGPPAPAAPPE